jgi:predicted amidohydrolase
LTIESGGVKILSTLQSGRYREGDMVNFINVAVVNFTPLTTKKDNLDKIEGFAEAAAGKGADLVLFPELCLTGYDFYVDQDISQKEKVASSELISGKVCTRIQELAEKLDVYIIFGMGEKESENSDILYNSAVVCGPDKLLGAYRKIHPFGAENVCFAKGSKPYLFNTPWGLISIGICYDTYQFPELMRYYVWKGSKLYLNPTALIEETHIDGSRKAFIEYYKTSLAFGVVCNSIFVASSNLVGLDRFNYFGGGSVIIGPKITPFYETQVNSYGGSFDNTEEGVSVGTLDLRLARRELCVDNVYTGEPDFRFELYKEFK